MSRLRLIALNVTAALLVAVPASADGLNVNSTGVLGVRSKPSGILHRSTHPVYRYYAAPRKYHYKAKPQVHNVKPVKRNHRFRLGHHRKRYSPYYIPQRYGIQHRSFRRGVLRHRY